MSVYRFCMFCMLFSILELVFSYTMYDRYGMAVRCVANPLFGQERMAKDSKPKKCTLLLLHCDDNIHNLSIQFVFIWPIER
jgi:hypothetical protein